jgi:hypothetical protein
MPTISYGPQPIVIVGRAKDRATVQSVPNSMLKLVLQVGTFQRTIMLATDGSRNLQFRATASGRGNLHRFRDSSRGNNAAEPEPVHDQPADLGGSLIRSQAPDSGSDRCAVCDQSTLTAPKV